MFTWNIDLGQILITCSIGIVGYLIKHILDHIMHTLDRHEDIIFKLSGKVEKLFGILSGKMTHDTD